MHARKPSDETVLVQITAPAHSTPRYSWDQARECLRFAGLVRGKAGKQAGDLGIVVAAPQVRVLVAGLGALSLAPDTLAECHVICGARDAEGRLALMTAIPGHEVEDAADGAMQASLIGAAELALPVQWLDARAARSALREAQVEVRRAAQAQTPQQQAQPAWKVPPGVDFSRAAIEGLGIFDAAPALLEYIPYRFQLYLAAHLLDDEHVIFFAERQETDVALGRWQGRQHVLAGLLLVTDRRVLLLEDRARPNMMLEQGSYQVEAVGMGRLAGVALHPSTVPGYLTLTLTLAAQDGRTTSAFDLPEDLRKPSEIAEMLLRGFLPISDGTADRRVRRVMPSESLPPSEQVRKTQAYVEQLIGDRARQDLTERLNQASGGQVILARAMTPAQSATGSQAVILTTSGLYHAFAQGVRHYPLASIAKATYAYSLAGCGLTLEVPHGEQAERIMLPFAHIASDLYNALFTTLSLALHTPYAVQAEKRCS